MLSNVFADYLSLLIILRFIMIDVYNDILILYYDILILYYDILILYYDQLILCMCQSPHLFEMFESTLKTCDPHPSKSQL
jgi:hypothetical protein